MDVLDHDEFDRWQAAADDARAAADALIDRGRHAWASFLAEQSAALALRGLLRGVGAAPGGAGAAAGPDPPLLRVATGTSASKRWRWWAQWRGATGTIWSAADVLVLARDLPDSPLERLEALGPVPPRVLPFPWTPDEFTARCHRGDPMAEEALHRGIWLKGDAPAP